MAEEKEKKNTSTKANRNTQSKKTNRRGQTSNRRRTNNNQRNSQSKRTTTKKVAPKKTIEKEVKVAPVEQTVKEEVKAPKETITKEEQLEKTLIFDGSQNQNLDDVVDKLEEDNVVLEDKVIKRSKVKKSLIIILGFIMACVLVYATYYVVTTEITGTSRATIQANIYKKVSTVIKKNGKLAPKSEPEELKENYENIETISLADLEQKIVNKEDIYVLIASTSCYHCVTFEPIIDEVFAENNQTVYRINVLSLSTAESNRLRSYYYFKRTPTLFSIKDGYVDKELLGTTTKDDLSNWLNS